MAKSRPSYTQVFDEILDTLKDKVDTKVFLAVKDVIEKDERDYLDKEMEARNGANDSARSFSTRQSAIAEIQLIETAKRECAGHLPNDNLAFDGAWHVYATALRGMGMDVRGTPPANMRGIFNTMRDLKARTGAGLAMDSTVANDAAKRFSERFPTALIPRRA